MAIESATYISDLVATNPAGGTLVSEGDDHIKLIKSCVKASFPSVSGAVTASHTELNFVDGVTASIQNQLNTLSSYVGEPYGWSNRSSSYTASPGNAVIADTSGGAWKLTLPLSPVVGNTVRVIDAAGTFGTNNLEIGRNSNLINGLAANMFLDISEVSVMFVYTGATYGWRAV